jgi:hypothetical protein
MIEILDVRTSADFKMLTFSNFKKIDAKRELLVNLIESKIEQTCYWTAELICSGHYTELWEVIILFYSKYIHLGNPKFAIYLDKCTEIFKELVTTVPDNEHYQCRNNLKIRNLFAEIMCILSLSAKKHKFEDVKIKKDEYDLTKIVDRFKAPNISYGQVTMRKGDPTELFIAMNELSYSVSKDGRNTVFACYWIEWITEFENICKLKKVTCKCERREYYPVMEKYQMDIVWMIWDTFMKEIESYSLLHQKIMKSLLHIFTLKYSSSFIRKRKFILYVAVSLLTEIFNMQEEILKEKEKVATIIENMDKIYKQVKKSDIAPKHTEVLLSEKDQQMKSTMEKLDKITNLNLIPRIF